MSQRRVLKVSYHGNRQLIRYKQGSTYDEILKTTMKHFQIPCKRKSASILKLTNEAGKVFSKPTPKITFQLQNSKESTASSGKHLRALSRNHKTIKTAITKQHRRQKRQHVSNYVYDPTYPTAAVFRMNCFVGVYPSKCAPPPVKRVRFSESSNSIRIIPARSLTPEPVKGALRRTNSFVGEYPQLMET